MTFNGKADEVSDTSDALIAASLAMGCVLFILWGLRAVFGKDDRNRRTHVGKDVSILNEAPSHLNSIGRVRCFPSCPGSGCAISIAPRGQDRINECENRNLWRTVLGEEIQFADTNGQNNLRRNLLFTTDEQQQFFHILKEEFGDAETPAWWRISEGSRRAPQPKSMPQPSLHLNPTVVRRGPDRGRVPTCEGATISTYRRERRGAM